MSSVEMDFDYGASFGSPPEAYERLLLDALAGDQTLFTRADWIRRSWDFLTPALDRWSEPGDPPFDPSGSWGPAASDALLTPDGRAWLNPD
jgi:glucose-6-phosphate 1-dehydrogenase